MSTPGGRVVAIAMAVAGDRVFRLHYCRRWSDDPANTNALIPEVENPVVVNSRDDGTATTRTAPRIGIALGAGGAKGIAHIPMLEALDELGVRPHRISGSSIGAVMGALYAQV